ncbi:MAG: SagB/ThcOx family dehydrogenase [Candidatus Thorarchaeota archaeon]
MDYDEVIRQRRELLKAHDYDEVPSEDWWMPHQRLGVSPPPLEKPYDETAELIDLVSSNEFGGFVKASLFDALANRMSRRAYTDESLSLGELSFLLWATQHVREVDKNSVWTKRAVPSGGGRQPYETYLIVNEVDELERGVYRYLPIKHKLLVVSKELPDVSDLNGKAWWQDFIGNAPVIFVWAAIPYKSEWRYSITSYKDILIEAGHICQNLYLACEAIGAGTCAIAAYDQKSVDEVIGVDGEDEITVYLAPVGKVSG